MKAYWKTLHHKINDLSLRERRLVALTSVIIMSALVVVLVCMPTYEAWLKTYKSNQDFNTEISALMEVVEKIKIKSKMDVNAPYKSRINSMKSMLNRQEEEIQNITATLILPNNMNLVFKTMMTKNNLNLIKFKNLPAKKVQFGDNKDDEQPLYKHEFRLHLTGKYLSFVKFIEQLETQKWQLNWDSLDIKIVKYPESELMLKYHTLSTSKVVLGL